MSFKDRFAQYTNPMSNTQGNSPGTEHASPTELKKTVQDKSENDPSSNDDKTNKQDNSMDKLLLEDQEDIKAE